MEVCRMVMTCTVGNVDDRQGSLNVQLTARFIDSTSTDLKLITQFDIDNQRLITRRKFSAIKANISLRASQPHATNMQQDLSPCTMSIEK